MRPIGIAILMTMAATAQTPQAILERRCLTCHNAEIKAGNLVLTVRPAAPERLLQRVERGEMPPGNKLPAAETAVLRDWVAKGAPWEGKLTVKRAGADWWSLQRLRAAPADATIDRFIDAALAAKNLSRAPEADRRTLIRRASFDLLGLPPTPAEVDAFVADKAPRAYENLVDRLLASPHYGERWGRHWLDVARFGESNGYEQNHLRERAWPYRDYVVAAFNQDKSFRQFVLEQLAADQVASGDPAVEPATGFLVAGTHDTVGIQNPEGAKQQRANDLDDMVIAAGAGFLGLTIGCARCHDHKFDPIRQSDYYRFAAVFSGVQHGEREILTAAEREERARREKPLRDEWKQVEAGIAEIHDKGNRELEGRRAELTGGLRPPVDSRLTAETFAARAARFVRFNILAAYRRSGPSIDEFEVFAGKENVALHAKVIARKTRTTGGDRDFYQPEHLTDGKFDRHWISGEPRTGQFTIDLGRVHRVEKVQWSRDRMGAFQGRFLSQVPTEYSVELSIDGQNWEQVADSSNRLPFGEQEQNDFLLGKLYPEYPDLLVRRAGIEGRIQKLPKPLSVYAGTFKQPAEPMRINKRGNPMELGDVAPPASPSAFERMLPAFSLDPNAPEGDRRKALAQWLTDDRNALTARVLANRVWHYHFGRGIVGTPSDFGYNGERPTHPELLDYLAAKLIQGGWRLKSLHREIMLSAAYRQSSRSDAKAAAVDSDARLLWRFPARRLDAEALRDATLAVTGTLNAKMGGPGYRLYKYTVDNVATYYPLDRPSAETYRRAVYHQWARSVKDDMLSIYDCPDSSLPEPKRVLTTTPLQALSSWNGAFLLDQAEAFARRLEREAGSDRAAQMRLAYRLAFGRDPRAEEAAEGAAFLERNNLALFCRVVLNANEFAYVR